MTAYKQNKPSLTHNNNKAMTTARPCTPENDIITTMSPYNYLDLETLPETPPSAIQGPVNLSAAPATPRPHKRVVSLDPNQAEEIFLPSLSGSDEEEENCMSLAPQRESQYKRRAPTVPTTTGRRIPFKSRPAPARLNRRALFHHKRIQQKDKGLHKHNQIDDNSRAEDGDHHSVRLTYRPITTSHDDEILTDEKSWVPAPANVTVPIRRCNSYHALSA